MRNSTTSSSSARMMSRTKQIPQMMSNNENFINNGAAIDSATNDHGGAIINGDYHSSHHHLLQPQLLPPSSLLQSNGHHQQQQQQSQQYVQINQGGQVHTMTRQQQQQQIQHPQQQQGGSQQYQQQQQQQQRQDNNNRAISRQDSNNNHNQLDADKIALTQKNHRLAKELSDLRIRHRDETKVVSRLTMENMNLASRCRQAISEAAELKRKVVGYEKRHADFGNLQKEVLLLRRQIEKQHGGGGSGGGGGVGNGGVQHQSSSKRNRSTSPKVARHNGGNDGVPATPVDEKRKKAALASVSASLSLETKNSGETTDLDRIMANELFKINGVAVAAAAGHVGVDGGGGNVVEKNDGNPNAVMKKFQELSISSSSTTTNNKSGGGSKVASSSSTSTNNVTNSSKRSVITPATASSTDGNSNISSANTKIPISVTTSSAIQNDDEFDAEMDMVDFFAKSQTTLGSTSSSSSTTTATANKNDSTGADGLPASARHTRSHIIHKMKKTETDDHMPEELVGSGDLLSPKVNSKKSVGDNLLSSLDAFEASFASAFPETSFSIKSEAPSSTQLSMSFDVPVFDPFLKTPVKGGDGTSATVTLQASPKSKLSSSGAAAIGNNHHKDGMKSQMKDLFPDSALTTSPKRGLDLTFDSTFPDIDIGGGGGSSSNNNKSGKGKSLSADKLDSIFSRAHMTTPVKASGGGGKSSSNRPIPLDMSAEIEQLDALASATEKADGGDRKRSVRKVKTPLSYAEPSTKQKLRRGDVLFPKIDAERKLELEAKRSNNAGAGGISPTTDLDRIMSEHFSVSDNKKDVSAPL